MQLLKDFSMFAFKLQCSLWPKVCRQFHELLFWRYNILKLRFIVMFIKVMRCSSLSSVHNRVISTSKPDLIIVHDTISWLEHSWDRPVHTAATVPQKFWNDFILSQIFDYISTEGAGRLPTVKEAAAEEEGDTKGNQLFLICDLLQHMMMLSYLFSLCYYNMTPPWCWNQKSGGC